MPVAVIPPGVQPQLHEPLQFFLAIAHFHGIEEIFCPFYRLGVIVEHDLHPVRVRKGKKALQVRKKRRVHIVADAAVGSGAPVGIDDEVVERNAVRFVIEDALFCAFLVVLEVA